MVARWVLFHVSLGCIENVGVAEEAGVDVGAEVERFTREALIVRAQLGALVRGVDVLVDGVGVGDDRRSLKFCELCSVVTLRNVSE